MTAHLVHIWRAPIKSHGSERLDSIALSVGQTMPWDRKWAVAHEGARLSGTDWAPCANFSRAAKAPELVAITSRLDEARNEITLTHPKRPELTFNPDEDGGAFIDWVKPLMPENRAQSSHVVRADRGMTDTDFASISINNLASHRAVEQKLGRELDVARWRGNLIIDGFAPWEEFEWIGKTIAIGAVELRIEERITRCMATTANPATGQRDADTLGTLSTWGHRDFGVYGIVTKAGRIATGDAISVL